MKSKALENAQDTQAIISRYMSDLGKRGGRASADSKTPERRKEIAMMGVAARKAKKLLFDKAV